MDAALIAVIGLLAVIFQSVRIIPQVIKGFVTGHVRDVSFWWIIISTVGAVLWTVYGYFQQDWVIITGNVLNIACYILLLYQKKTYPC